MEDTGGFEQRTDMISLKASLMRTVFTHKARNRRTHRDRKEISCC